MNRQEAINIIEGLYPTDSPYIKTNTIGERLLAQAKSEYENWRDLPDTILFRYAVLCEQEENRRK
jgi:hypothetical protein